VLNLLKVVVEENGASPSLSKSDFFELRVAYKSQKRKRCSSLSFLVNNHSNLFKMFQVMIRVQEMFSRIIVV